MVMSSRTSRRQGRRSGVGRGDRADPLPHLGPTPTLTLAGVPADAHGPAHLHWILGYEFVGDPATPLRVERDDVAWHDVTAVPSPSVADLGPLLAALVRDGAGGPSWSAGSVEPR